MYAIRSYYEVSPVKPFHLYTIDKNSVTIYANKKTARHYEQRVKQEIEQNFAKGKEPKINICDDLTGIVEFPFEMDNQNFKNRITSYNVCYTKLLRNFFNLFLN